MRSSNAVARTDSVANSSMNTTFEKSEHLGKYMYKTEGMTPGTEVTIQLPGLIGIENLKLQPEYNTGSDVAQQIKRQNEWILKAKAIAKDLKEEGDYADVAIPGTDRVIFRVFKPTSKEPHTLEQSEQNWYHEEIQVTFFTKQAS